MKRGRLSTDRFPNYMTGALTLSAANTFTTESIATPIPRLPTGSGATSTIMELLYLELDVRSTDFLVTADQVEFGISVGSSPSAVIGINNPSAVLQVSLDYALATSGSVLLHMPIRHSLQEENGFGFLLAADTINTTGNSVGMAAATIFRWRLYYRFVNVSLTEYIGIVQSQSQT